jgi:uncharacterized protein (UPF0332 family)
MIQKAERSLAAARRHIEQGDYDFGSSRAYYGAFYAMEAALISKGLSFSTHSGIITAFNQHYVKTAILPADFGKGIARLFRERQTADYVFDISIGKEDALRDLEIAERIVEAVAGYLKENGLLPDME